LKVFIFSIAICLTVIACNSDSSVNLNVSEQLTQEQQHDFIYSIIRYIGRLPRNTTHSNKFDSRYDTFYHELTNRHQLRFYGISQGYQYFIITRIAPSIKEKYVAIGGRVKWDGETGKITDFEEIFRTWKMPLDELLPISEKLLQEAILGKDLSKYYPENSGDDYIIEFPSSEVTYDKVNRVWVSTMDDVLEELHKLKQQTQRDKKLMDTTN
jgi:hypothetical protein